MGLDFPASGYALWDLYDKGGPRPEFVLPVLAYESGGAFSTTAKNPGSPNYGLNQINASWLTNHHIALADYLAWPASTQIRKVVTPFLLGLMSDTGPLNSGIQVYQANFVPASLNPRLTKMLKGAVHYAPGLDDVIVAATDPPEPGQHKNDYNSNVGLDGNPKKGIPRKGWITPRDLGEKIADAATASIVKDAIAKTYALRPTEVTQDPVFGAATGPYVASLTSYGGLQPHLPPQGIIQQANLAGSVDRTWVVLGILATTWLVGTTLVRKGYVNAIVRGR
jgi:hypothetical protein